MTSRAPAIPDSKKKRFSLEEKKNLGSIELMLCVIKRLTVGRHTALVRFQRKLVFCRRMQVLAWKEVVRIKFVFLDVEHLQEHHLSGGSEALALNQGGLMDITYFTIRKCT